MATAKQQSADLYPGDVVAAEEATRLTRHATGKVRRAESGEQFKVICAGPEVGCVTAEDAQGFRWDLRPAQVVLVRRAGEVAQSPAGGTLFTPGEGRKPQGVPH